MEDFCSSKAAGVDKLSRFLKDGNDILTKPVSALCNLSISRGVFPSACKVAKLKPIFKKGKKTHPSNYRPISLLPVISKITEKVVHDQTNAFLTDENILYHYQSGLRENHSTNFDTIDHEILKKPIRFSKGTLQWFRSYLSERIFLVNTESKLSDFGNFSWGTTRVYLRSPFFIYVNDMPQAVKSTFLLYADDSCILYRDKEVDGTEKHLNKGFENICDWFMDNKLSIYFGEDK